MVKGPTLDVALTTTVQQDFHEITNRYPLHYCLVGDCVENLVVAALQFKIGVHFLNKVKNNVHDKENIEFTLIIVARQFSW